MDIPGGRSRAISSTGELHEVLAYDGWPNEVLRDGRLLVADCKLGLGEADPVRSRHEVVLSYRYSENFLGLNDLQVTDDDTVWFTDQGQTGLHDASSRVYRWKRSQDRLDVILDRFPSPNGLRVAPDGQSLAVTRANAAWQASLKNGWEVTKVGRFASIYGPIGPDGLHLHTAGRLCVSLPSGDAVWLLDERGEVLARLRFPRGSMPTNGALDDEAKRAYVTYAGAQTVFTVDGV